MYIAFSLIGTLKAIKGQLAMAFCAFLGHEIDQGSVHPKLQLYRTSRCLKQKHLPLIYSSVWHCLPEPKEALASQPVLASQTTTRPSSFNNKTIILQTRGIGAALSQLHDQRCDKAIAFFSKGYFFPGKPTIPQRRKKACGNNLCPSKFTSYRTTFQHQDRPLGPDAHWGDAKCQQQTLMCWALALQP